MKKLILTLVMSAFAFSSFAMQATVVSAKGKAEMKSGGSWFALKAGDSIDQGTEQVSNQSLFSKSRNLP